MIRVLGLMFTDRGDGIMIKTGQGWATRLFGDLDMEDSERSVFDTPSKLDTVAPDSEAGKAFLAAIQAHNQAVSNETAPTV